MVMLNCCPSVNEVVEWYAGIDCIVLIANPYYAERTYSDILPYFVQYNLRKAISIPTNVCQQEKKLTPLLE